MGDEELARKNSINRPDADIAGLDQEILDLDGASFHGLVKDPL